MIFFQYNIGECSEISIGEGSLEQSHVDSLTLLEYKANATALLNNIDATVLYTKSLVDSRIF